MRMIIPAATVILLRDVAGDLLTLLLRRNSRLGFAGGAWVFPGGRVDPAEIAVAQDELAAARQAAVRETLEEAQLRIEAQSLRYYAHWTTPPVSPKRFATWFFVARAPLEYTVTVDGSEIHDHLWVRPDEALERRARGEIELLPPTYVSLIELAQCGDVDEVLARVARRHPPVFEPCFIERPGHPAESLYAGDAGYGGADPDVPGPRHRTVLGKTEWQYLNDGIVPW